MSMSDKAVTAAKAEAKRFLKALDEMCACTKHGPYDACPSRAAAKRASLDLTRALARMRQP